MSPASFYELTIRESNLVLEGYEEEKKDSYNLNLHAFYNALGLIHGGKNFKMKDPFKAVENTHKISMDEKQERLDFLNEKFEKWR